ncbi:MAG: hypothetical protein EOP48_00105 [Sphingobacteriales bacterium]|nr:MAG: hypothetical protein EOP48_00105 [Sphingobacteriales bacterium]
MTSLLRLDTKVFSPMLLTAAPLPPEDSSGWVYEQKYDGARCIVLSSGDLYAIFSREGNNFTDRFPELGPSIRKLSVIHKGKPFVLDGEVLSIPPGGGTARFEPLQQRLSARSKLLISSLSETAPVGLVVFDILLSGAHLLTDQPLSERRGILEAFIPMLARSPTLFLSEQSYDQPGILRKAREELWEGIVAKDLDSSYYPGVRSSGWIKHKLTSAGSFIICGFRRAGRGKEAIGSLTVATEAKDGSLVYAANVRSGFTDRHTRELFQLLSLIPADTSPLSGEHAKDRSITWVRPLFKANVKYLEMTKAKRLRQSVFVGIWSESL